MRWCLVLIVAASCGKSDPKPADRGSGAPVPPPATGLAIFIDDQQVATLPAAELDKWPRLDTVVPVAARRLGKWDNVTLVGGAAPVDVHAPSTTYPELVPAVFPGKDRAPAFGMFDPVELAKHGNAALREDHLREVRIKLAKDTGRGEHEQGQGGGSDPMQLKIAVKTAKGTTIVDGAKLLAIPRVKVPGTGDGTGWTLQTILDTAGVKQFEKLVLTDAKGTALNVDKTAFDPNKSIPFVKLNRQGLLRLRVFIKEGENWNPNGGDLREFTAIEVVK